MKRIIFFISCFFIVMNTTWAMNITCPEVASPGEIINVHLEGEAFNGIVAKYKFDSGFIYQGMTLNSSWKNYYDGIDGFSVGDVNNDDKLSMDIKLKINMNVQVNKEYTLGLFEIEGNDNNYKSVDLNDVSCSIKLVSNVNTLDSLIVEGVNLSPNFNKGVTSYQGTTKNEKINIKAIASDNNAKVEGDIGEKSLNVGVNTFVVKVTSSRGDVLEYKIYITRVIDKKSSDVTLKSLTLSVGKINFNNDNFLYSVDVDYKVDNVVVEAVPNDSKAKVDIQKEDKLVVGENNIKIVVTAEDGTTATYVIVINRMDKPSSDATIKELRIKNYEIDFRSDVYEYELEIDNEDKLEIDVILSSNKAKYVIKGNKDLNNNNAIEIEVTAEDGSKLSYSIRVKMVGVNNSNSINDYISLIPVAGFVILVVCILIIKLLKFKVTKRKEI